MTMVDTDKVGEEQMAPPELPEVDANDDFSWLMLLLKIVLSLVVLAAAAGGAWMLFKTRPKPERAEPKKLVEIVNVVEAKVGSYAVSVPVMATVTPARRIVLKSEVSGRIIERCPQMLLGGLCKKGDLLVRIDPREYEFAVRQAQAVVDQAQSELSLEEGRQVIAKSEWALLGAEVPKSEASRKLALREPQLTAARARLSAAKSRLDLAKLNLERTTIRAPFNAKVVAEKAESTQLIERSTELATLIGTDKFWLRASIPVDRLRLISLPDIQGEGGSSVKVILLPRRNGKGGSDSKVILLPGPDGKSEANEKLIPGGKGAGSVRLGRVIRLLGDVDERSRMARLLIEVDDPLALKDPERVPLLAGSRVQVLIDAIPIEGVVKISRAALREGERVWIMDAKDQLDVRKVKVAWRARDSVLVHTFDKGTGIREGERIVTSLLSVAKREMALKIEGEDEAGDEIKSRIKSESEIESKSKGEGKGKDGE